MAQPPSSGPPIGYPPSHSGEPAARSPQQLANGEVPVGSPGTDSTRPRDKGRRRRKGFLERLFGKRRREEQPVPPGQVPGAGQQSVSSDSHPLLQTALANWALRDLTLVESLLRMIEELEEDEEDPEQLDSLFRIDHLATRLRRNGENLLVLAGQDAGQQKYEPTPLLDVVRAGISEIADYSRAEVATLPSVRVSGVAADDVSHLLAELMDNATSKSPEQTPVLVSGRPIEGDAVVLAVEDNGIGIPAERLADLNARLASPPVLDVTVTRHMGLYVVGRLAHRHGIWVQLQARPFGGTAAYVVLPAQLVQASPATEATRLLAEETNSGQVSAQQSAQQGDDSSGVAAGLRNDTVTPQAPQPPQQPAPQSTQQAPQLPQQPAPQASQPPRQQPASHQWAAEQPSQVPAPAPEESELPRRTPGAHAQYDSTGTTESQRPTPPRGQASVSAADRLLEELDGFTEGQRAASQDFSAPSNVSGQQSLEDAREAEES